MQTMSQTEYLLLKGQQCPYCKSENVQSLGEVEFPNLTEAKQTVTCNDCRKKWKDIFKLSRFEI